MLMKILNIAYKISDIIYMLYKISSLSQISYMIYQIQSTLVILKSKGPSETLRDIRTSTYQMCRIEEKTNRTTKFHK